MRLFDHTTMRLVFALSLLLWTSACSALSAFSLTPTPTPYVPPTEAVTPIPSLTESQLQNATYTLTSFDNASYAYTLVDGKLQRGASAAAPDFADISMLNQVAFGDLTGDGIADAAVLLAQNYGGSGVFVSLNAVLNMDGQPVHSASTMIDDRPQINKVAIRDGAIVLDAVVHSVNDPACCPTFEVTRRYKLIGISLVMVNATSKTPAGQERAITIERPLDDMDVSGVLVVVGSVTIAPFENTLSFRAYNDQGNQLLSGPIMVIAPEIGAPGTFNATLDLTTIPPGRIRIEVSDLSEADGSVLALDSVEVVVR